MRVRSEAVGLVQHSSPPTITDPGQLINDDATSPEAAEQPSFSSVVDGTNNFPSALRKEHWPTAMSPKITGTEIPYLRDALTFCPVT